MGRNTTGRPRAGSSLDGFKLWYEDLPPKKAQPVSKVFHKPVEQPKLPHRGLGIYINGIKRFIFKSSEGIYMGVPRTSRTTVKNNVKVNKKITSVKDDKRVRFPKISLPFRKFLFIMDIVIKKIKGLVTTTLNKIRGNGMPNKNNNKEATANKTVAQTNKSGKRGIGFGILGVYMAFVIASIIYSCVFIKLGTSGWEPLLPLLPQATFAGGLILIAFWKLAKNW